MAFALSLLSGVTSLVVQPAALSLGREVAVDDDGSTRADLLDELRAATNRTVRLVTRTTTGNLTFLGGSAAHPLQRAIPGDRSSIGRRFVERYGSMFGVDDGDADADLVQSGVTPGRSGSAVRFQQLFKGVPILAGTIAVQIDDNGAVLSATGETGVVADLDVRPSVEAADATVAAVGATARADRIASNELTATDAELWIYDPSLIGADAELGTRLVWRVEVTSTFGDVNRLVLVDAQDGTIALQFSQVAHAKNRVVCDNNDNSGLPHGCTSPVRVEGQLPVGSAEVNNAYDLTGVAYDFYMAQFGRDSIDGAGQTITTTVRFCPDPADCPYDNAFWDGEQLVFGAGWATDDLVGHEYTHGVTETTAGLLYYSESGAINESISDIMGELIDLSTDATNRWIIGEDLPGIVGGIRSMSNPPAKSDPDRMTSPLFVGTLSDIRGVHSNSGVSNKAAFLITDGGTFNGQTIAPLGLAKTAKIYYQALTTLLGPGSDYLDLGVALPQACINLIGVGGAGITGNDCAEVSKAVLATEMNLRPTKPGASLTAPVCESGIQNAVQFLDDMETDPDNWDTSRTGGLPLWDYFEGSSQSGSRSINVADASAPAGISTLTQRVATAIPSGTTTYLRFDHSFHTDYVSNTLYDGGVVEFSVDNGGSWADIATLPGIVNGYNDTIDSSFEGGVQNPLHGRSAFGTISPTYQTTRVNLTPLAGQSAKFRFIFGSDNYAEVEYPGWFLDDVSVYSCGAAQAPGTPRSVTAAVGNASVNLAWQAPLSNGGSPITGYRITPSILGLAQPPIDTGSPSTTTNITGLLNGSAYTFTVAAMNAIGSGVASAATAAATPATTPTAPTSVVAAGGNASALLSWSAPSDTGGSAITSYTITPFIGTTAQVPTNTASAVPSFAVTGLSNGTTYTFSLVANNAVGSSSASVPSNPVTPTELPTSDYEPLVPARLMETRSGLSTADGMSNGIGKRLAGTVTELQITGRAGIPAGASAAALNITVTEAEGSGFIVAFPCGTPRPTASNLNFVGGQTIPNFVIAKIGDSGRVCIFTTSAAHILADVNGYFPTTTSYVPIVPARLLESRPGLSTIDGQANNLGIRLSNSITELQVAGRANVPANASTVVLNITATEPDGSGFITVFPCGAIRPTASNLNVVSGQTIPNLVVAKVGANGKVCIFTSVTVHIVADLNGYFPVAASYVSTVPVRLLETRPGLSTEDGQFNNIGIRPAGSVTELRVAGRAGIPARASTVVLNVTATEAAGNGFLTVYPCDTIRPTASNLNFVVGETIPNLVIAKVAPGDTVCIFTSVATHIIADVNGYYPG